MIDPLTAPVTRNELATLSLSTSLKVLLSRVVNVRRLSRLSKATAHSLSENTIGRYRNHHQSVDMLSLKYLTTLQRVYTYQLTDDERRQIDELSLQALVMADDVPFLYPDGVLFSLDVVIQALEEPKFSPLYVKKVKDYHSNVVSTIKSDDARLATIRLAFARILFDAAECFNIEKNSGDVFNDSSSV